MTHTRDELLAAVAAAFQADELVTVVAELDRYGIEPHELERERVHLEIFELSAGIRDKVVQHAQIATKDYLDILVWKELGPLGKAEGRKSQDEARALIGKRG